MAKIDKDAYKDTPETLLEAIRSMQTKIEDKIPEFEAAELTYEAEMGDGRTIIRANPLVQEFRALVKDYATALRAYEELGGQSVKESDSLADLRNKFKVMA